MKICLLNFFFLSLVGLLLRAYPLFHIPVLAYKNVLHAHSHFAFGGWAMPALVYLILRSFPEVCSPATYIHWRNSVSLMLISAYGMLLSFPFQGYGAVSIAFSTLLIIAGVYMFFVIRHAGKRSSGVSWSFLKAGFFYLLISSVAPFLTGPLIASGYAGTPIYYNVIYFFLHFQYNGFFTFVSLAIIYRLIEESGGLKKGQRVFCLMNIACIPSYFLSVLWAKPSAFFYIAGGVAAAFQVVALVYFLKDAAYVKWTTSYSRSLFRFSLVAFALKVLLQLASAFPRVADLAYTHRNLIIAYLHLVLIGFISLLAFAAMIQSASAYRKRMLGLGLGFFLFAFSCTEILLIWPSAVLFGFIPASTLPHFLFGFSLFFPAGLGLIFLSFRKYQLQSRC